MSKSTLISLAIVIEYDAVISANTAISMRVFFMIPFSPNLIEFADMPITKQSLCQTGIEEGHVGFYAEKCDFQGFLQEAEI